MWLLSTDRAELHYFARNSDANGGYAILSHTWGEHEQSFQEVQAIGESCRTEGTNPRDYTGLSPKIREFLVLVQKNGYHWAWADSCCIDKTSSSELSEAINSMYQWYAEAEVCYAYLADVPGNDDLEAPDSAFQKSRWHTRGWTLQELIAPEAVIFLSADWSKLGNRAALAKLLQGITRVPSGVLTGADRPAEYSASMRMTWATGRTTTRVEDQAYCLMGLFGVNMPTNYGEGKKAFIRLQYEIMRQSTDMSLFAFGRFLDQDDMNQGITLQKQDRIDRGNPWQYLMADSPRHIINTFYYIPDLGSNAKQPYPPSFPSSDPGDDATATSELAGPFDSIEMPRISVTSYGVKLRLPVAILENVTIAVMLVCTGDGRNFGLFLTRDSLAKDPKRPRYFTGCDFTQSTTGDASFLARMADLGIDIYNLTFNGRRIEAKWRTIYIVPAASHFDAGSATIPNLPINSNPDSRFRIPRWLVSRLANIEFEVDQVRNTDMLQVVRIVHRSQGRIWISLGTCTSHHDHDKPPPLWAKANIVLYSGPDTFSHDCSEDHIDSRSWATRSKDFGDPSRRVRLSFTPSVGTAESKFLISLELFGTKFEEMLRDGAVSFPSLADLESNNRRPPHPTHLSYAAPLAHSTGPIFHDPITFPTPRGTPSQNQQTGSTLYRNASTAKATLRARFSQILGSFPMRSLRVRSKARVQGGALDAPARGETQDQHEVLKSGVCGSDVPTAVRDPEPYSRDIVADDGNNNGLFDEHQETGVAVERDMAGGEGLEVSHATDAAQGDDHGSITAISSESPDGNTIKQTSTEFGHPSPDLSTMSPWMEASSNSRYVSKEHLEISGEWIY